MSSVTLLHPEETFKIPALRAITKCSLFQNNPSLLVSPYQVQSSVSLSIFREFLSALDGNAIKITDTNLTELHRLCREFGFTEIAAKLSEFRPSMDFKKAEDADARGRIAVLEEKSNQHSHVIAILQTEVTQLSTDFGRLAGEVSALRSASAGIETLSEEISALKAQNAQKQRDAVVEQFSMNFIELRQELLTQKAQIAAMPPTVISSENQPPPPSPAPSRPSPQPPVPSLDSRIISDIPEIFAEFRKKQISLLWRGSRDGFRTQEFHRRCDGHANTLTVILDTKGNIFGGFTPLEWESRVWNAKYEDMCKADDSLKSFLFTLKNPNNIPAKIFALNDEWKHRAIEADSKWSPIFGYDICPSDTCNWSKESCTGLDGCYPNDIEVSRCIIFTGSQTFQVKEIKIFKSIN
jgi:FtsZ-binding cell division protein ZapB